MAGDGVDVEEILDQLRGAGLRVTASRRAIVSSLLSRSDHLTTDALVDVVRQHHPDVSRATVYRTISVLDSLGLMQHHQLSSGPARYHLHGRKHEHLVCEVCGQVVSVTAPLFARLVDDLRSDYGFEVREHLTSISGRCADCARNAKQSRRARPSAGTPSRRVARPKPDS